MERVPTLVSRRSFSWLAALLVLLGAWTPAAVARATRSAGPVPLEGVPRLRHVFVIVLENEDFNTSWGPTSPARYLKSLRSRAAFADQYYGVSHKSADNYIAMASGEAPSPLFQADCQQWFSCEAYEKASPGGGRSVADQLEQAGLSWVGAMDSMATPCQHPTATQLSDPYSVGYATRHNPFVYYPPIVENQRRCAAHVRPYAEVASALAHGTPVPNFVFITPDTCHDGHDATCPGHRPGGLVAADPWLATNVPLILGSKAFQDGGALFITFDESRTNDLGGCCATGVPPVGINGGGRVGLLALSPIAKNGRVSHTPYDHNSLLRTIEDGFGICEHLNNAGSPKVHPMADLFGA